MTNAKVRPTIFFTLTHTQTFLSLLRFCYAFLLKVSSYNGALNQNTYKMCLLIVVNFICRRRNATAALSRFTWRVNSFLALGRLLRSVHLYNMYIHPDKHNPVNQAGKELHGVQQIVLT